MLLFDCFVHKYVPFDSHSLCVKVILKWTSVTDLPVPAPFPITAHALTWFHSSLMEHTCKHLPPPFISSLTSVTHRLVLRLHGCMVAWLHGCMVAWLHGCMVAWLHGCMVAWLHGCMVAWLHGCMVAWLHTGHCLPVYPWNSSLPVDTQVYKQWILFILLPEHSSLSLFCWKLFLSYFNKFPFDLHLPVCLLWPVPWQQDL